MAYALLYLAYLMWGEEDNKFCGKVCVWLFGHRTTLAGRWLSLSLSKTLPFSRSDPLPHCLPLFFPLYPSLSLCILHANLVNGICKHARFKGFAFGIFLDIFLGSCFSNCLKHFSCRFRMSSFSTDPFPFPFDCPP